MSSFKPILFLFVMSTLSNSTLAEEADLEWFGPDNGVRKNFDLQAHGLSYDTLYMAVGFPFAILLIRDGYEDRARTFLGGFVVNNALTFATKAIVSRPRPYNYNLSPEAKAFAMVNPKGRYYSFYSGHASNAFLGGIGGSLLTRDLWASSRQRDAFWFLQSAFASSTAAMRVVAGVHYYTDVAVGALAGTLVAIAAATAEDADLDLEPGEYLASVSGLAAGVLVAKMMDYSGYQLVHWQPEFFESGHMGFAYRYKF